MVECPLDWCWEEQSVCVLWDAVTRLREVADRESCADETDCIQIGNLKGCVGK